MGLAKGAIALTSTMVKELYKGKKYLGGKHAEAVKKLSKNYPTIAKGVNISGQKFNQAFKYSAKKIKKYPKISSAVAGGVLFDLFTRDYEDEQY